MDIKIYLEKNVLIFDGAMGTMLQKYGLKLGEKAELFNIKEKEIVEKVHREYIKSGAMVITTNTFGANTINLKDTGYSVEEVIDSAVNNAKRAREDKKIYIALDIGPLGHLLGGVDNSNFKKAYDMFARQVIQGEKSGADVIIIETMSDIYEAKAAVMAAKENSNLPVFCTFYFKEDGRTIRGNEAESVVVELEYLGVDAIGINCTNGRESLLSIIKRMKSVTSLPIIVQPNAGLPYKLNGKTIYKVTPKEFSKDISEFLTEGACIIGGCCGTTPEFIKELRMLVNYI